MQRSDLKFAPALCTMLVFGVLIHPFVLSPGKFPFLYHSLGDERVCSPAARSATRRWLWDVSGFAKVPGISLQMLNVGPWSSFPGRASVAPCCSLVHSPEQSGQVGQRYCRCHCSLRSPQGPWCESVHLLHGAQPRYLPMKLVGLGLVDTNGTAIISLVSAVRLVNHL